MDKQVFKLSLDAIAGFMLSLQKAVAENLDLTDMLESMDFVEQDGMLFITNMSDFQLDLNSLLEMDNTLDFPEDEQLDV
jgi:hypothetical protein